MSDPVRLLLVVGALLAVPGLVVLFVSGSGDTTVVRRDGGGAAPAPSPAPPTSTPTPAGSPGALGASGATAPTAPIAVPDLSDLTGECRSGALLDEQRRRGAFRDGLEVERGGGEVSDATGAWLTELSAELERCAASLGAGRAGLRGALEDAVAAARAYRGAVAAPRDHSVSRAWGDLDRALSDLIVRWADAS